MLPYGKSDRLRTLSLMSVEEFPNADDHAGHGEDGEQDQHGQDASLTA